MNKDKSDVWQALSAEAQAAVAVRDYGARSLGQRIAEGGVDASQLAAADRTQPEVAESWIPGVEIFARTIHPQRHRGFFGEFVRREEGVPATIGLWPNQWAAARMFAHTAKGFHIHPPSVPKGVEPAEWFRRLFLEEPIDYSLRRYESEQWDAMFFVQGMVEMILREARVGLPQ